MAEQTMTEQTMTESISSSLSTSVPTLESVSTSASTLTAPAPPFKITPERLQAFDCEDVFRSESDKTSVMFGSWLTNPESFEKVCERWKSSVSRDPTPAIIIPDFLNDSLAHTLAEQFPTDVDAEYTHGDERTSMWHRYHNPIEVKYANDHLDALPVSFQDLFLCLSTKRLTQAFSKITGIESLSYDPYLHGAGLHLHPRYGRLGLHLDYEKHPLLPNKQRQINIILYLSQKWNTPEWHGETELWNVSETGKPSECWMHSSVVFNSALVFQTTEMSYHGVPERIMCPEGVFRQTLAYYYISDLQSASDTHKFGAVDNGYRVKASFVPRPSDPYPDKMNKLYEIRPYRRITSEDMARVWPEWTPEL